MADKALKFTPGMTVYRAESGHYISGAVRLDGMNKAIRLTKTVVKSSTFRTRHSGYGINRKELKVEYVALGDGAYSREYPATRAHVWTEAQYAEVKDEYERKVAERNAEKDDQQRRKRLYVEAFLNFALENPAQAVELVMANKGLKVDAGSGGAGWLACTVCWEDHRPYHDYDHEPEHVQ